MAIDATAAAATGAASAAGRTRLAENFDTFLSLLTTQLKNQDPLSPMDSTQFTQQIVQMTGVEQQLLTNDLLLKLVGNTGSGISTAVSLIGKDVRAVTGDAALVNGKADWLYKLDAAASDVKLEVLDSNGRVVSVKAGSDNGAGEHAFSWDGKDTGGKRLPDGTYTLRVTAKAESGETITSTTFLQGVVTGVEQSNGEAFLVINGARVPWNVVTSVTQAPTQTTSNDDDADKPAVAA
ncbi:flagellar hook assembly protein FlgD [Phenylobacterium sp.]|uniref:flagellar hook assembly protein FlgD n=1 Tax=Phenylobacterium sp. TaxID=1871053 RepID=UPI0027332350|nr:flagellar hook assembly protein FlgD [Phenylobacterium sp.]MDP3659052.1 flagellar hook assembly protein FlgD [Phenylobacterium sp.]